MFNALRRRRKLILLVIITPFLNAVFGITNVFALSNGPEQVEYTSYESVGATDMVNLITGDFTYNMPLIDVPGPEGSFAIPLFYHAGITPEQDASWTGLGWNVNVGCITRSVVGYPDDAYDLPLSVNVNDPGGRGWVKNFVFYKRTFDSQKGYGGGISILDLVGVEWDNSTGLKSGTVLGMDFNKGGIKGYWAENVMNVGRSVMTLASMGAFDGLIGAAGGAAKFGALDIAMDAVSTGTGLLQGYLSEGTFASSFFNWSQSTEKSHLGFRADYKYWLDDTRTEWAFGALYLGSSEKSQMTSAMAPPDFNAGITAFPRIFKVPFATKPSKGFKGMGGSNAASVGSDMYLNIRPFENYANVVRSNHISFDVFNVMTEGVSGSIAPYRTEVGSLAQPNRYSYYNFAHNLIPFLEENDLENKVHFYYPGQYSNKYLYHDDANFGIDHSTYVAAANTTYGDVAGGRYMAYTVTNNKLLGGDRTEVDGSRLKNKKVVSGKNIEWYTREEILSGTAKTNGFIDYEASRPGMTPKGIEGFSITKEDGLTYHYAYPVYRTSESSLSGIKNEEEQKYSTALDQNKVAISWLLTAITGPDFIDRGTLGIIDDSDWGYWVKFSYGKNSSDYNYRFPYYGYNDDGSTLQYSQGSREQVYLNSVETRSHKALFIKGVRTDGLSSYLKRNDPNSGHHTEYGLPTPTPPLYLDEVILLSKVDFNSLTALGFNTAVNSSLVYPGALGNNGSLGTVFDIADVNASFRAFIDSKALRKIKFGYETNENDKLCKKALNSFSSLASAPAVDAADIYANKNGKLTLKRLQFFGRNNLKVFPDFKFDYAYNPDYNKDYWDGWGYYNPYGSSSQTSHTASQTDLHGAAWSLTKITLPTGGTIAMNYERDSYSSISGEKVLEVASHYSSYSYNVVYGGPITLGELKLPNSSQFQPGDEVRVTGTVTYNCPGYFPPSGAYNTNGYGSNPYSGIYTVQSVSPTSINLAANYMGITYCSPNSGTNITIQSNIGSISKVNKNKKGGDLRVAEIVYSTEFGEQLKTKYTYTLPNGNTSGVIAKEPEFIKNSANPDNYGLDNMYDYPMTPVLYSSVTVHSDYNRISNDYSVKQVYTFETPHKNQVTENTISMYDYVVPGLKYMSQDVYLKQYAHKIDVKTAKIGKLISIAIQDKNNVTKESFNFSYTETPPLDQGKFTSGSILSEFTGFGSALQYYCMKLIKTTKVYHPYVLSNIIHTTDGLISSKEYKSWDFFTGIPLVTETKSPGNFKIREERVPAYSIQYTSGSSTVLPYAAMGLKGFNKSNSVSTRPTTLKGKTFLR
ncbi:MAG: hypothetical protein WKF87_06550 [Chryseolinea sp.]